LGELLGARERLKTKAARGWVNSEEYKQYKEKGTPNNWCGGVSGGQIKRLTNEEMEERISINKVTGKEYTKIEFQLDISGILDELIENLEMLLKYVDGNPDLIRAVF